jgi:UPF0042 nucleotide-binding protein
MRQENSDGTIVVLIAGYRYAGKSLVLQHLEQAGYACVDNLPVQLVPECLSHGKRKGGDGTRRVAIAVDADGAERDALGATREMLAEAGFPAMIVFIEASDSALSERHAAVSVAGSDVARTARRDSERDALAPIRAAADLIVDSSWASPMDIQDRIIALAEGSKRQSRTVVEISSFGFKNGVPSGDFVVDVRFIPNPYYVAALRPLCGKDRECADYVFSDEHARGTLEALIRLAVVMEAAYSLQGRPSLRIRIGCTGGWHRSVAMVEALGAALSQRGLETHLSHRELDGHAR